MTTEYSSCILAKLEALIRNPLFRPSLTNSGFPTIELLLYVLMIIHLSGFWFTVSLIDMLRIAITMEKFEFLINQVEVEYRNESCSMEILLSEYVHFRISCIP